MRFCVVAIALMVSFGVEAGASEAIKIKQATEAIYSNRLEEGERLAREGCAPLPEKGLLRTTCFHMQAHLAKRRGDFNEAEQLAKQALASWNEEPNGDEAVHVSLMIGLGDVYRQSRQWGLAKKTFEEALAAERARTNEHSPVGAEILSRWGATNAGAGDYREAIRLLSEAIPDLERQTRSGELAFAYTTRGMSYTAAGDYANAEADLRKGYKLAMQTVGESDPQVASYINQLAVPLIRQGKTDQAELLLIRARAILEQNSGKYDAGLGETLAELATVYASQGKFEQAIECDRSALRIVEKQSGRDSAEVTAVLINLANVYLHANRLEDAERVLPEAVAMQRRLKQNPRGLVEGVYRLAQLRALEKRWNEAGALFRETISLYESVLGPQHAEVAAVLREYAAVLRQTGGSKKEVQALKARAKAIDGVRRG